MARHLEKKQFYVAGTGYYQDNMMQLAVPNPKWETAKAAADDIVKVFRYNFTNKPLVLEDDPDYPGSLRVMVKGLKIGVISSQDAEEVKELLQGEVKYTSAFIKGGESKVIATSGDVVEMDKQITAIVTIGYVVEGDIPPKGTKKVQKAIFPEK